MTTSEESVAAPQLGPTIRRLRRAAGLTMQELAKRCDLSQPFLSQIENSRAMPSLLALHRVAQALGTTNVALLEPDYAAVSVVRADAGDRFVLADGATLRFLVPGEGNRLEANEAIAAPGVEMEHSITHVGQEMLHVLSGSVTVELEGRESTHLEVGDTIVYPAAIPHRWRAGDAGSRFLMVVSPPSF